MLDHQQSSIADMLYLSCMESYCALKKKLLADKEVRKGYDELASEFTRVADALDAKLKVTVLGNAYEVSIEDYH